MSYRRTPTPMTAQTKPHPVTFMRFNGWGDALQIFAWLAAHDHKAYYVPEGFEHDLRTKEEHDRGNGHLNPGAEPFLAVYMGPTWIRVSRAFVIVMAEDESISVMSATAFAERYEIPE